MGYRLLAGQWCQTLLLKCIRATGDLLIFQFRKWGQVYPMERSLRPPDACDDPAVTCFMQNNSKDYSIVRSELVRQHNILL
jgi:hypothetical protein